MTDVIIVSPRFFWSVALIFPLGVESFSLTYLHHPSFMPNMAIIHSLGRWTLYVDVAKNFKIIMCDTHMHLIPLHLSCMWFWNASHSNSTFMLNSWIKISFFLYFFCRPFHLSRQKPKSGNKSIMVTNRISC